MANTKISALTTLAGANLDAAADFIPVVDTGASETKKITPSDLVLNALGATAFAATQAQQETGSITTAAVTPGTQQYHASAAKGWTMADAGGTATASYNVSSITDGGVGIATVNWGTDFSSASYCSVCSAKAAGASAAVSAFIEDTTFAAGVSRVNVITTTTGAFVDPNHYMCAAFGDQ